MYAWESRSHTTLKGFLYYNFVPVNTFAEEWNHYSTKIWHNVDQHDIIGEVELYVDHNDVLQEDVESNKDPKRF